MEQQQRCLRWRDGALEILDQTLLPGEIRWLRLVDPVELGSAISRLAVRGAPALGVAGAYGVVLAVQQYTKDGRIDGDAVRRAAAEIAATRPTAVNLAKGVYRALDRLSQGYDAVLAEAVAVDEETENANREAARRAADVVEELCGIGGRADDGRKLKLLTHCNAGWLATVAVGTALGAVTELARRGRVEHVLVDETRPLLQGSRLTAWELRQAGIPHSVCVDSAAAYAMSIGMVDCVLVGADRITAAGDVANKVGTYGLAVAAAHHGIPLVVVATEMTVDEEIRCGADIVIEQRSADEVLVGLGPAAGAEGGGTETGVTGTGATETGVAEPGATVSSAAFNPAFDVTPAHLIAAVVTEGRELRNHSVPRRPSTGA